MELLAIVFCLLLPLMFSEAVQVDRVDKKAEDVKARSALEKMLWKLDHNQGIVKDAKGNGLRRKKEMKDKNGNKFIRIEQLYEDLKVFGFEMVQRENKGSIVDEMDKKSGKPTGRKIKIKKAKKQFGKFAHGLEKELGKIDKSKLNPTGALEKLKKQKKAVKTSNELAESVIFIDSKTKRPQIAYEVSFRIEGTIENDRSHPIALYDQNNQIIIEWDNIQRQSVVPRGTGPGGNGKTGKYHYGLTKPFLNVTEVGSHNVCWYQSDYVRAVNLGRFYSDDHNTVFVYSCYNWDSDAINGAYSPLNDAYYFGNVVYNMYNEWYKSSPSKTLPLTMKVHVTGLDEESAFFEPTGGYVAFGDGGNSLYPLVSLDIVAHEIGHLLTHETSGLKYRMQSGGLNEAFSDMAGKAAERYALGGYNATFNWGIGYDIVKSPTGQFRCMDNPPCDGCSIDNVGQFHDFLNVHCSSGIFNKVFYLLANDFKYDVWDAFDLFYVANTKLWQPTTTFIEAAELTLQAMDQMKEGIHLPYKYGWINIQDIVDAFNKVGIQCTLIQSKWDCV